jgi:hypothetical protein
VKEQNSCSFHTAVQVRYRRRGAEGGDRAVITVVAAAVATVDNVVNHASTSQPFTIRKLLRLLLPLLL